MISPPPGRPASNTPYLVAVVIMALFGIGAVLGIMVLRPDKDNTALIAQILTLIVPTTAGILAFMKSQETHLSVNSRLDDFMATQAKLSRAEGIAQGAADEAARAASSPAAAPPIPPSVLSALSGPTDPVALIVKPPEKS